MKNKISGMQIPTASPVEIENDANCAGIAEIKWGSAQNHDEVLYLTFGTGIGGALISEGRILHGFSGSAGEAGHLTLYPNGRKCGCGKRGCAEKYISSKALEVRAFERTGKTITARDLFAEADQWTDLLEEYSTDLSIFLGSLINLLNPEVIICSGGLFSRGGGGILASVEKKLPDQCFASSLKGLQLIASEFRGDAGLLGAAGLVF